MINNLSIKNFKSIKDLKMACKKLNVFIGEPNSGKSNIIEALSLRSQGALDQYLCKEIFRYKTVGDLFYDFNINIPIKVDTEDILTILKYAIRQDGIIENQFHFSLNSKQQNQINNPAKISHDGKIIDPGAGGNTNVHFYEYKRLSSFSRPYMPHLSVPHGDNLPSLLLSNSEYKKWVSEFLQTTDLKITLKPTENDILVSKLIEDEIYSYPYFSLSETMQRVIFYNIALKSNKNSILLFDEPESNTFPFYTKYLAERIALDKTNQFFITTHNPYLLLNLIEKSKEEDLNICITRMKNYQTSLSILENKQISEVLDLNSDVFFNIDKILG